MKVNEYYDYVAIIRNLDARTFKISARDENEARATLKGNLTGDDYTVKDFVLKREGVSEKKEVTITNDFWKHPLLWPFW